MAMKVNYDFVVQGILIPIFESTLHCSYFGDIVYSVGLDVSHTKNVGTILYHTPNSFIKDCCLDIAGLDEDETKDH